MGWLERFYKLPGSKEKREPPRDLEFATKDDPDTAINLRTDSNGDLQMTILIKGFGIAAPVWLNKGETERVANFIKEHQQRKE